MKKKVIVLSLGGSLIIPEEIDTKFLKKFKKIILKNSKKYKFVVVCGGGNTARKYIQGLEKEEISNKKIFQGLLGISSTRINAKFLTYFIGKNDIKTNKEIPHNMVEVKNLLKFNDIVFCGALRYAKKETSDGTSAKLSNFLSTEFINLTNVDGLYDKNPKKFKNAKFIPKISWKNFNEMANEIKFKPGQHFVLDQTAAKIIMKNKIPTYIIGENLKNLDNFLNNKKFKGTKIKD